MMMTIGFSGCIGGTDVETDEGDDGELSDDWPTYYVLSATDLPVCDANTLGRLYYVEADTNFQACTSTGWTVVQIQGPPGPPGLDGVDGSTSALNLAPVLSASVWDSDDDMIADDGDGTYSRLVYIDWIAMDFDGTIVSLGIDYDGDGVIDIPFSQNSGLFSDQTPVQSQQGEEYGGAFIIPLEVGNSITQMENYGWAECALVIQSTLIVMAVDDDGATTYNPMVFDVFRGYGQGYFPITGWMVNDPFLSAFSIPQTDIDWVTGASSSCPSIPQLSLADHPDALTTGQSDNLAILTVDDPGDWGNEFYINGYCVNAAGDSNWLEDEVYTFTGADEANPQAGDYWTISEDGTWGSCDSGTTGFQVRVDFGDEQRITLKTEMS
mgnify:CR=1 FL=1